MTDELPLSPATGFVQDVVREEFPGLRLHWITVTASRRHSPPAIVARLSSLSNRYRGASVVAMRTKPVPQAYRAFFRQIGLDPDVRRIPSESAAVERLLHGGFRPVNLVADACLIALVETGVPVWAMDADHVDVGGLGIRTATEAERGHSEALDVWIEPGTLVVADAQTVHGLLFAELDPAHRVTGRTERVALFSVAVDGVPGIHVEEALWMCADLLA
ncbi:MAG TPA: phenylalanine--tRNA ligase beta subunit-related protein [Solirubrobacteraceae bacterium]